MCRDAPPKTSRLSGKTQAHGTAPHSVRMRHYCKCHVNPHASIFHAKLPKLVMQQPMTQHPMVQHPPFANPHPHRHACMPVCMLGIHAHPCTFLHCSLRISVWLGFEKSLKRKTANERCHLHTSACSTRAQQRTQHCATHRCERGEGGTEWCAATNRHYATCGCGHALCNAVPC